MPVKIIQITDLHIDVEGEFPFYRAQNQMYKLNDI